MTFPKDLDIFRPWASRTYAALVSEQTYVTCQTNKQIAVSGTHHGVQENIFERKLSIKVSTEHSHSCDPEKQNVQSCFHNVQWVSLLEKN